MSEVMTENTSTESIIQQTLSQALEPAYLDVINESHMHNVPANSETHFKVVVVSQEFEDESLIKRHRKINHLLADQLAGGVHALSLHTMTEAEWLKKGGKITASPKCLGGDGSKPGT